MPMTRPKSPKSGKHAISPNARRRGRECALHFLFGLHFTQNDWEKALPGFWETTQARPSAREYAGLLIRGVMANLQSLDEAISGASERWSAQRIGPIERNIIRIALFEMLYRPDVPTNVAINEAIEIAKRYGAEDAPRFVNGILDKLREG